MYVTHKRGEGDYQPLLSHLKGVAARAAAFAEPFGAAEQAQFAGMLHDIGKYSPAGQRRQLDPEHAPRVDHSTAGTQEAYLRQDISSAFAICGHHGGLPDRGTKASTAQDGLLISRLRKPLTGELDPSPWKEEVGALPPAPPPAFVSQALRARDAYAWALYTRMLFSCLVDADYLDTEAFLSAGQVERPAPCLLSDLLARLREYVAPWLQAASTPLNQARSQILSACLAGEKHPQGLYTLTVPTGGGKTVSSLAFALSHAVAHEQRRVIYVIPYTSIIEQNAQVFRRILGEEHVLEHHAQADFDPSDESPLRLATENWDAPVIVTTAVQFFESLHASRPSRCRKLHHIAHSVVIFDEAQTLPLPYLAPCVHAITELVQHYGVTAVLCTATQPSLGRLIARYAPTLPVRELCPAHGVPAQVFRRVQFAQEGTLTPESLALRLAGEEQALCIVNSRAAAQSLYRLLPEEGRFHLSTLMTPAHRAQVLSEIRARLASQQPCRVVSTSLIEAGVDVDFPCVWREKIGLDSILQAAGRCNREGKRPLAQSIAHIFCFDEPVNQLFRQNIQAANAALAVASDLSSPEAIRAYFDRLLLSVGDEALDQKDIARLSAEMRFRTIEEQFHLIDSGTQAVYIPCPENEALLRQLRAGEVSRALLRSLSRYAVNVFPNHLSRLCVETLEGDWHILLDAQQYDERLGLALDPESGACWFA